MEFAKARDLAKKVIGSKIKRDGNEYVVISRDGELITEVDSDSTDSEELMLTQPLQNNNPTLNITHPNKTSKPAGRVKGVGPDMRWKGKKVFNEPYTDMMNSGKVYEGSYGTGKKSR